MATNRSARTRYVQPYRYPSPNVPLAAIRRFARQIAERFHPEQIVLFGSYAYGTPHNWFLREIIDKGKVLCGGA
jgi:hypothetical protein